MQLLLIKVQVYTIPQLYIWFFYFPWDVRFHDPFDQELRIEKKYSVMVFVLVFWYNIFFNPQLMINSRWTIIQNFCFSIWIVSKMSIENILLVILIPYAYLLSRIHSYQDSKHKCILIKTQNTNEAFVFFLSVTFFWQVGMIPSKLWMFVLKPLFKNRFFNWFLVLWSILITILLLY